MRRRSTSALFAVAPPLAAALIGSIGALRAAEQYEVADKPAWAPPARVFGPVWTGLYTAIGVAGWRLFRRDADPKVLALHGAQLVLNAAWPFTFFTARNRTAAVAVNTALDIAIAAEIVAANRRHRVAAMLLTPYLAWSLFATALSSRVQLPAEPT